MSENDKKIEQQRSELTQNESFKETEKILNKLKNEVEDVNEKEQITSLLDNLEKLKTTESNELTNQIDSIYKQLISIKALESLELTEEEINTITKLTESIAGFKTELFDLKETVAHTGGSPLDKNDDKLDDETDSGYYSDSPLDNKTRRPIFEGPVQKGKELFSQKDALKRGGIAGGTVVAGLSLRRLRKKRKTRRERKKAEKAGNNKNNVENNNNNTNNAPKEKKKSKFWRRTLGILGIGGGIYTWSKFRRGDWSFQKLRDWLKGKEKGPDIDPVIENEEEAAKGFEDLMKDDAKKAKKYNNLGENINNFSNDIYRFSDGSINKVADIVKLGASKDKYSGAIPYVMDNTYENIGEMNKYKSMFQLMAKADHKEIISTIKEWATDGLDEKNLLVRMVLKVLGYDSIKDFVDGGGNKVDKDKVGEVNIVFQKILRVMAYTNLAENAYALEQIKGKTIQKKYGEDADGDANRNTINNSSDSDKQAELIQDMLIDPESYRISSDGSYKGFEAIREEFSSKKLHDIAELNINLDSIKTANSNIYEEVDKINKERNDYHSKIENGHGTEVMDDMIESCEDTLSNGLFASFTRAVPLATLLELTSMGGDAEFRKEYMKNSGFKKLVTSYKDRFEQAKGLSYDEQKAVVDEYLTLLKEINTTTASLQEIRDKDGGYHISISSTFEHLVGNTRHAFTTGIHLSQEAFDEFGDGNYASAAGKISMSAFYIAGAGGVSMLALGTGMKILSGGKHGSGIAKAGWKISIAPISVPTHLVNKYGKIRSLRHTMSSHLPHGVLSRIYKGEKLSDALRNGLSFSKAYEAYASNGWLKLKDNTNLSKNDFLRRVFDTRTDEANNVLGKYLFDGEVPSKNANAIWKKFRKQFIRNTPGPWKKNEFTLTDKFLEKLKPLTNKIDNPEVLQSLVRDRSIKNYKKIDTWLGKAKNKAILKILNDDKQVKIAQNIAQDLSSKIKSSDAIDIKVYEKLYSTAIGKTTKGANEIKKIKVRGIEQFSDTEKILGRKLNNSISDMDKAIKQAKNNKLSGLIKELEAHKKTIEQLSYKLSISKVDDAGAKIISELLDATKGNYTYQKKLFSNLVDDSSEIHDAIRALNNSRDGQDVIKGTKTIKKLLGLEKDTSKLGDEIIDILKITKKGGRVVSETDDIIKGIFKFFKTIT